MREAKAGSMPPQQPECKYRVATPHGQANICRLGRYDGLVTDGMCRICIRAGGNQPGLGDMVKAGLSAVGITEERVSKAIGRPCGCGARASKLNELGHKYLGLPPGETPAS